MRRGGHDLGVAAALALLHAQGFTRRVSGKVEVMSGSAAAWLVWQHRRQLHRAGAVDMKIPKGKREPPWYSAAIGVLRDRKGWRVEHRVTAFERVYRLVWERWPHRREGSPS